MDMFNTLFGNDAGDAIGALGRVGFSPDHAARFLPEAEKRLVSASVQAGGLNSSQLHSAIDIDALSRATNVPADLVEKGVRALLPVVMSRLNAGYASGLLSTAKTLF